MKNELYQKIKNRQWHTIEVEELLSITKGHLEQFSYEELNWFLHYLVFEGDWNVSTESLLTTLVDRLEEHLQTQETGMIVIS